MSTASMQEQRNMADLQAFVEKGLISEQQLQQRLQALKEAHQQQLVDAERRQREGLEKRMQLNSLLTQTEKDGMSSTERQIDDFFNQDRTLGSRRSVSLSELSPGRGTTERATPPGRIPQTEAPGWVSATTAPHFLTSPKSSCTGPQPNPGVNQTLPTHLRKEAESMVECGRKFRAAPVPSHVFLPLYKSLMEEKEAERKRGVEQRQTQLLSMQKPFSFQHREKEKGEELVERMSVVTKTDKLSVRKSIPKAVTDSTVSDNLREAELSRKLRIQARAQETLRSSIAPVGPGRTGPRTAQHSRMDKLAFLDETPTFQPRTSSQVPDFSRLHRAFQKEALRRSEVKDGTKCMPFDLRTSCLPLRPSQTSPGETPEEWPSYSSSVGLKRLLCLSSHTLPTYITDAARKRCTAIRKSVEQRESQAQESAEWMRGHQRRSQALSGAIALRAKVLDPHSSLREVVPLKLKQHREADQQRMKDYKKELQDMKERVTVRPYLFEQVTQRNAKVNVERVYRNKLQEAGLNERFVETNGEGVLSTPERSRAEDEDEEDEEDIIQEHLQDDMPGNADDGGKMEELEEESVESRGVETER